MKRLLILFIFILGCEATDKGPKTGPDGLPLNSSIKVGAFNIQIFGTSKMSKPTVVKDLVKIISQYDLILIQEIRDASETAIHDLLSRVNSANGNAYSIVVSSRLGRSSSKEQYAYIYRKDKLEVLRAEVYADSSDVFEREPYVVSFREKKTTARFFLVGIHTKPDDAVNEINHLDDVYYAYKSIMGVDEALILGDFNQDCSYVSNAQYNNLDMVKSSDFLMGIYKTEDTTIGTTDCAYDQIVMTGSLKRIYSSVKINKFQGLSLETSPLTDISDHYPVEVILNFGNL